MPHDCAVHVVVEIADADKNDPQGYIKNAETPDVSLHYLVSRGFYPAPGSSISVGIRGQRKEGETERHNPYGNLHVPKR